MASKVAQLPSPALPWSDPTTGKPSQAFLQFMTMFAANPLGLVSAANDAAAASAGVAVGGIYLKNGVYSARMT